MTQNTLLFKQKRLRQPFHKFSKHLVKVIFWQKGETLNELRRYEEGLQVSDEAIRLDPNDRDAFHNKAVALLGLGRNEEAGEAFKERDRGYIEERLLRKRLKKKAKNERRH
jgi:tetratricopeptide (TPR) repeat protein